MPAHKPTNNLAPNEDRLAMLCLAIADDPRFFALTIELDRPGTSYTLDTVRELRAQHPADTFVFIIGADTLGELHTWHKPLELLELVRFVTLARPGTTPTPPPHPQPPPRPPKQQADLRNGKPAEVSSRAIRSKIAAGEPCQACPRARPALHSGAQPIPMNTKNPRKKKSRPAQARNPKAAAKTATPKVCAQESCA